jgi:hypothetical protein
VSEKFATYFNLFVCDINPSYLIPGARLAQRFIQVPRAGIRANIVGVVLNQMTHNTSSDSYSHYGCYGKHDSKNYERAKG